MVSVECWPCGEMGKEMMCKSMAIEMLREWVVGNKGIC